MNKNRQTTPIILKKIFKLLLNPKKLLYKLSQKYIRNYEGFSYEINKNGEGKLLHLLHNEKLTNIFDIGANRGEWSMECLKYFKNSKIYTFELSRSAFKKLQINLNLENIKHNNLALSDKEGEISYKDYGEKYDTINTIIPNSTFWDNETEYDVKKVLTETGDNYCLNNKIDSIDFLKIDVEGAELLVLKGFLSMLKQHKIKVIQFEYGYVNADLNFLMKDFFKFFDDLGYEVGVLKPNGVIFKKFEYKLNGFESGPNFLAILKSDNHLKNLISAQ